MDDLGDTGLPNPNDVSKLADVLTDHLPTLLDKLRLPMKLQLMQPMRVSSKGNTPPQTEKTRLWKKWRKRRIICA